MLLIRCPRSRIPEREYIYRVLIEDFLGIPVQLAIEETQQTIIENLSDPSRRRLAIADVFLETADAEWLSESSLPNGEMARWNVAAQSGDPYLPSDTPALFVRSDVPQPWFLRTGDGVDIMVDIFGGTFFLLSRYEELVSNERDSHGRFSASQSLAARYGFLDRPLVNEYAEILWSAMSSLWPGLRRRNRSFTVRLTHDVDCPFYALQRRPIDMVHRALSGLRHGEICGTATRLGGYAVARMGSRGRDPGNTFDFIMKVSEKHSCRSTFYFLADKPGPIDQIGYDLDHPWVQALLDDISIRGHEIGLHASYASYGDREKLAAEFGTLRAVLDHKKIRQTCYGSRQHYLRWAAPQSWSDCDHAGLDYDASAGFADRIGFRTGSCYEHRVYDLTQRCTRKITERPLMIMDQTLFGYEHRGKQEALNAVLRLRDACRRWNGDLNLLWHNTSLETTDSRAFYAKMIDLLSPVTK